ncbi:hypothetical protein BJ508DRAFT_413062 [Ascobolus immersus RN42]|uniref:Uncharacterized protein n=1 Tax=Ascobolus immersus RN42 TaxID=1160509 RepID=A0A3N4IIR2_ASCIM|nr:hypothetical protein BJ508DRAFT_413062 [Ascobolus immersus RN42]
MGTITIPLPVPTAWMKFQHHRPTIQKTANRIFRLQLLAILLLTISTTLLGVANFAGGSMAQGRRLVFRRRHSCAIRGLRFAFVASTLTLLYTLLTFTTSLPLLAFRSRKLNSLLTFLLSILLVLACVIPICVTRVDTPRWTTVAFDRTLITGCVILGVVAVVYGWVSELVAKVLVLSGGEEGEREGLLGGEAEYLVGGV